MTATPFHILEQSPDALDEFKALRRSLALAESFKLIFVVASPEVAETCDQMLQLLYHDKAFQNMNYIYPVENLYRELKPVIFRKDLHFVSVRGLQETFDDDLGVTFANNINVARDLFPKMISCPLIIYLDREQLNFLTREAPDFFSIRSGIFELTTNFDALALLTHGQWQDAPSIPENGLSSEQQLLLQYLATFLPNEPIPIAFIRRLLGGDERSLMDLLKKKIIFSIDDFAVVVPSHISQWVNEQGCDEEALLRIEQCLLEHLKELYCTMSIGQLRWLRVHLEKIVQDCFDEKRPNHLALGLQLAICLMHLGHYRKAGAWFQKVEPSIQDDSKVLSFEKAEYYYYRLIFDTETISLANYAKLSHELNELLDADMAKVLSHVSKYPFYPYINQTGYLNDLMTGDEKKIYEDLQKQKISLFSKILFHSHKNKKDKSCSLMTEIQELTLYHTKNTTNDNDAIEALFHTALAQIEDVYGCNHPCVIPYFLQFSQVMNKRIVDAADYKALVLRALTLSLTHLGPFQLRAVSDFASTVFVIPVSCSPKLIVALLRVTGRPQTISICHQLKWICFIILRQVLIENGSEAYLLGVIKDIQASIQPWASDQQDDLGVKFVLFLLMYRDRVNDKHFELSTFAFSKDQSIADNLDAKIIYGLNQLLRTKEASQLSLLFDGLPPLPSDMALWGEYLSSAFADAV